MVEDRFDVRMSGNNKRVFAFVGGFGSGKTEIAINFALLRKALGKEVAIADLDVVNLYFRSREHTDYLEERGIRIILPPEEYRNADVPMITPTVMGSISNRKVDLILDIGGEEGGIGVLGYLSEYLLKEDYKILFVINGRRPFTRREEDIVSLHSRLREKARGLKINSLVNNTNLMEKTTGKIVKEGENLLKKVSKSLSIPIAFNSVAEEMSLEETNLEYPIFWIKRFNLVY
ncbi:MAG: hypothetical protein U9O41_04400 [Candidatus Aerophobetes bacterium]|nr:hypothetical protein [Candidatus Aerophobetes bacterium]